MRTLDVRRHSKRERPNRHLSQDGVLLARHVGRNAGPYERVVTSSAWRCVETAVAMGFAVDEATDALHMGRADALPADVLELETFEAFAAAMDRKAVRRVAEEIAAVWAEVAAGLSDGGRGLVVGHGVLTELAVVAALPDEDHAAWGKGLGVCEGVRLTYEKGRVKRAEVLRVSKGFKVRGR